MFKQLICLMAVCAAAVLPARAAGPMKVDGITKAFRDVTLGLAEPGIIHREFFQEGDFVQQGQTILEFDKKLEELEVTRRKAVMDQDKLILDSTRQVFKTTKSVSKQDLAKAQAQYDVAAAQYAIAVRQLADRRLVAPFAGRITAILLHPGAACAPYQPLVRLVDTSRCYFIGYVPGTAAGKLQLNEPVKIEVDGGRTVTGKICFISPVVEAASGLCKIKAIFRNPDGKIRPGLAAKMFTESATGSP